MLSFLFNLNCNHLGYREIQMKIAVFGASGMIGQRVLAEAVRRGHSVTAVVRNPSKVAAQANVQTVRGDLTDAAALPSLIAGHDVVVSAFAPPQGRAGKVAEVAHNLVAAVKAASPSPRLIAVGGAGGLKVSPDMKVIDTPGFPAFLKPVAQAHIDAYQQAYSKSDIDWTFLAPAAQIQPGERTGKYRTSRDQLVADAKGGSNISAEDYAVALLDEIERPQFRGSMMAVGY